MAALTGFDQAASVKALRGQAIHLPPVPASQKSVQSDWLLEMAAKIEGVSDNPFAQEFARGVIQEEFGMRIPTSDERMLQLRSLEAKNAEAVANQRKEQTRTTLGFLVDNADADAGEALLGYANHLRLQGIDADFGEDAAKSVAGLTLQEAIRFFGEGESNVTLDGSLIQNPKNLRAASGSLSRAIGLGDGLRISYGDTLDFDQTKGNLAATDVDRSRDELASQVQAGRNIETRAEQIEEFADGPLSEIDSLVSDQMDVDLKNWGWIFKGDLDSRNGAIAMSQIRRNAEQFAGALGPEGLLQSFAGMMQEKGIPDIMMDHGEIAHETVRDSNGMVVVRAGEYTPTDATGAGYAKLMVDMVGDANVTEDDLFARLNIAANKINQSEMRKLLAEADAEVAAAGGGE